MAFVYVGRLSYDKSVDELLRAFEIAANRLTARDAILYLVGNGELLWLVKEYEQRLPGQVRLFRCSMIGQLWARAAADKLSTVDMCLSLTHPFL